MAARLVKADIGAIEFDEFDRDGRAALGAFVVQCIPFTAVTLAIAWFSPTLKPYPLKGVIEAPSSQGSHDSP